MLFAHEFQLDQILDVLLDSSESLAWCAVAGVAVVGIACYALLVAEKRPSRDDRDEIQ